MKVASLKFPVRPTGSSFEESPLPQKRDYFLRSFREWTPSSWGPPVLPFLLSLMRVLEFSQEGMLRSGGNSYSTTTTQLLVASIMMKVGELLPDNVHIPTSQTFVLSPSWFGL